MPDDLILGYSEGHDPDSPEPSANRSALYQHGFRNGRDDVAGKPRATAAMLRKLAARAEREDGETMRNHAKQVSEGFGADPA